MLLPVLAIPARRNAFGSSAGPGNAIRQKGPGSALCRESLGSLACRKFLFSFFPALGQQGQTRFFGAETIFSAHQGRRKACPPLSGEGKSTASGIPVSRRHPPRRCHGPPAAAESARRFFQLYLDFTKVPFPPLHALSMIKLSGGGGHPPGRGKRRPPESL